LQQGKARLLAAAWFAAWYTTEAGATATVGWVNQGTGKRALALLKWVDFKYALKHLF
jgi:hypothetical protein